MNKSVKNCTRIYDKCNINKFNPLYWLDRFEKLPEDSVITLFFLTSLFIAVSLLCVVIVAHKI